MKGDARKPDEPALVTALFARRFADPFARLAVRLGLSADAVTVAGGLCWLLSLPLAPLAGWRMGAGAPDAPWLWGACALLWCAGYGLDVVDGSVARLTGTASRAGFFLDNVFHLLFKPAFLFSVGLGVALQNPGRGPCAEAVDFFLVLLAVLSLPANGAAATSAAELTLCEEVACGHLRPDGAARPALWLGAADVADPAALKRRSPLRAARTLAQETLSYYLQAPFFALLVAADLALRARCPWDLGAGPLARLVRDWEMPLTAFGFAALSLLLALRIPLRLAVEGRRLGRPTRAGRGGRALARLAALATALGAAALALWPAAVRGAGHAHRDRAPFLLAAALAAGPLLLALGGALRVLSARASRRAGDPIHNRFLRRAFDLHLAPPALAALLVFLAGNWLYAGFHPDPARHPATPLWPVPLLLALAPLAAVAVRPVCRETLAHVLCQETGKGRLRPGDPAPWGSAAAPARAVALAPLLPAAALLADVALLFACAGLAFVGLAAFDLLGFQVALPAAAERAAELVGRGFLPISCATAVGLAAVLLLSLPRRLGAARRALREGETPRAVEGTVVRGHGVASGRAGDPRFPGGTIAMQMPFFRERGLDLSGVHPGTINLDVAPWRFRPGPEALRFEHVAWHPVEPAETFSFARATLVRRGRRTPAWIYWPHPETKPGHFQPATVVEILAPRIPDLAPGDRLLLETSPFQALWSRA